MISISKPFVVIPVLNLRRCRHPRGRQPVRRQIRVLAQSSNVPVCFQRENQANPAKRRVYLLNDKMPTGLLVSPAMNHGGPFPATGHPGFTAVGIPASLLRFAALYSYDNVREPRLPAELRDKNPTGSMWRRIDGAWTRSDVPAKAG